MDLNEWKQTMSSSAMAFNQSNQSRDKLKNNVTVKMKNPKEKSKLIPSH